MHVSVYIYAHTNNIYYLVIDSSLRLWDFGNVCVMKIFDNGLDFGQVREIPVLTSPKTMFILFLYLLCPFVDELANEAMNNRVSFGLDISGSDISIKNIDVDHLKNSQSPLPRSSQLKQNNEVRIYFLYSFFSFFIFCRTELK